MLESLDETIDASPYEHSAMCFAMRCRPSATRSHGPKARFTFFSRLQSPTTLPLPNGLAEQGVLAVPGTGFGRSGYMRLSLTIPLERIEK